MDGPLEFVFSFRSPYVWIAALHVLPRVDPAVEVRWTPFFPLPGFANFGRPMAPGKVTHNLEDILRLARAYDLKVGSPPVDEPDWVLPHAAFLAADRADRGAEFALAVIRERWGDGKRVCEDEALRRAAGAAGLDADSIVAAGHDPTLRDETTELVQRNYDERGVFGVPMFVLPDGQRFWGHDRMDWAIRHGFVPGEA